MSQPAAAPAPDADPPAPDADPPAPDADPPAPDADPAGADASDTRPVDVHPVLPADLTVGPVCRRRVPVRGGTLAVAEIGEPTAPAWVLAHGVGSSARFVAAAFAGAVVAAGARLVVHDLRGHGGSVTAPDVADHHLDVHVADLAAVVAATAGAVGAAAGAGQPRGGPAVVGGISLGGHAAVRLVSGGAVTPEVVLACLPAWTGAATPGEGPHAAVAAQVAAIGIDGILAQLRDDRALAGWLRRTLVTDYARHDPVSLEAALRALDGGDAPSAAELAGLPVPLAVMAWPQDPGHPLAVAERWVALTPRAALGTVTIGELEAGVARLGRAAVATVTDLSSVRG